MKLENIHSVYFIGIGGIGMSALAHWFLAKGCNVAGYDRAESSVTDSLVAKGAKLILDNSIDALPSKFVEASDDVLIIYTPAISSSHPQLQYFQDKGAQLMKRSQVLGLLSKNYKTLAIAGTHGKTTTSSLLAHIVYHSDRSMVAFLGGVLQGYDSNFLLHLKEGEETYVVVEADEFDRSFLTLYPDVTVVTNVDPDHLDIYGDEKEFIRTFNQFVGQLKPGGKLFKQVSIGDKIGKEHDTYGINEGVCRAENVRFDSGKSLFDYIVNNEIIIADVRVKMPGFHNVMNTVAAISVALEIGISGEEIKAALACFGGIKRRFEFVYESKEIVFVDDYAHHPKELDALLRGVRAFWPNETITILFQPHLYSRTQDFMNEFAESLSLADEVLLLDIYPAREEPISGVTSAVLLDLISIENKAIVSKEDAIEVLPTKKGVVLTAGAGDIGRLINPIKQKLEREVNV